MSMTACLAIVSDITGTDSDAVLAAVDLHRAAGMSAADAQRTAASDLLAEIDAERAEIMRIVRTQHEDLFIAPPPPAPKPEPYKTKFFEPQTKAEAKSLAEDAALQAAWLDDRARSMGYRDIDQLADRDFDAFMALADEWRETNPAEMMMQRVFHGTPYRGIEKFDTARIGTGEGAQAYGYGLYFASRKEVADFYRKNLAARSYEIDYARYPKWDSETVDRQVKKWLDYRGVNPGEFHLFRVAEPKDNADRIVNDILDGRIKEKTGQLYEVEIPEDNEFLLWDKPLSEQPAKVREALKSVLSSEAMDEDGRKLLKTNPNAKGSKLYGMLGVSDNVDGERGASQALYAAGIRGIKYLDGTSRAAGDGSYNYVLFSGEDAQIAALHMSRASQTSTPEFKRWFGESKVVDAEGKPLVVYHGARARGDGFSVFRGPRSYFAESPDYASIYAGPMGDEYTRPSLMPVYLSIQRPLDLTALGSARHAPEVLAAALEQAGARGAASVLRSFKGGEKYVWELWHNPQLLREVEAAGFDGVVQIEATAKDDAMVDGKAYMTLDARQIKSAIGNTGAFDPANPDIRMARATPSRFTLPEFGRAAKTVEAIQNRYNRWKQVVETVGQQGGVVSEANDFYRAEERYWGKVASRIEDFGQDVEDFVKALTADGIDMRSMQLYAYAKHAKERNAYLRTVRAPGAGGFDAWSGMSDEDADAIIADAKAAGLDATFDKHHATLMGWTQGTRDLLLDEGLITDDQYLTLQAAYDNYVPLGGKPGEQVKSKPGTGKGFNIRGKETERARGRYSEADNIIEQIIQARVTALTRAGKNEVLRSFLQFVMENPDPTLWEVNAIETRPVMTVDDQGNQIIEEQRSVVKDDRTVGIKDGGKEVFVKINDEVLREQMKNLNAEEIGVVHGHMLAAQRMLGRLYTSLSPTFTVLNFSRDTMAASLGMLDEAGFKGAAKLWAQLPRAVVESFRSEFGQASPDYQLFRATGGKTGFMNFRDIPEIAADLQKSIADASRSGFDPRVWGPKALRTIEKINAGLENANRFAAFQAARSEGKSLAEAAKVSKNITVNFNRKGTLTNALSAYFLFFNPAVQGTVRVMQGLKSPKTLATLGAGMTGVAMLALQNASMGDDDDGVAWWDKIPPEVKDRNFIIVLPDVPALASTGEPIPGSRNGRYIKVPMPYGWNWFATVANQAADLWRHSIDPARGVTPAKAAARTAGAFLAAYMPAPELTRSFENSKGAAMALVPDFINAPVGAVFNLNAFGRQMYPDYDEKAPDSTKYFAGQAGTIFQRAAAGLNAATGGDAYSSGLLDFTPATLESLTRAYGGGPASFILDTMNAMYVRQSIERPDLDVRRLPFAKQLYGRIDAETDRMLAYERMNTIAEKIDPVERAKKAGNFAAAREYADDAGQIAKLGGALKSTRDRLSTLRKQELAIISADQPESVKYARLQSLEQQRRKVLQDINRAYDAAMRAPERKAEPALQ